MKFAVESLFDAYRSLGVVGVNCVKGLRMQPDVSSVLEVPWPQSDMNEVVDRFSEEAGPFDYWLKISPGPVPHHQLKTVANRFIYMPCFESTQMTMWFPDDVFQDSDIFACPSHFVKNYLQFNQPKVIWNHGVDPFNVVLKIESNLNKPLRILFAGTLDTRKYGDEFIELFVQAYGHNKDIELVVKCQPDYNIKIKNYDNIKFIQQILDKHALNELYSNCDVFMMPSRGEAFGMMGLDAAAAGLPIITTDWGGQRDYIGDCIWSRVDYKLIDTPDDGPWRGQWAQPDNDSIINCINEIIDDRSVLQRGIDNQQNIITKWSWQVTTRRFLNQLNQLKEYA